MNLPLSSMNLRSRPLVSVIMPVYNGECWLAEAIDSALAQTYPNLEIVIVNDGSTDDSLSIAEARARQAPGRVRVIDQDNTGLPGARNAAMARAQGEYFALLDADDAWEPEHIARAMEAFEHDPDLGLVHANIERVDADGQSIDVPPRVWDRQTDAFEAIALRHEHVSCPTAVFSRSALEAVGGFDPAFTGLGCEDRDLWLRIAARFRIAYLDHVAARYRVHPTSMSQQAERMARARRLLIIKLARSPRGRRLASAMEAMMDSDTGLELLESGLYGQAVRQQWRALRLDPTSRVIQRRLVRAVLTGLTAGPAQGARWLLPGRRTT